MNKMRISQLVASALSVLALASCSLEPLNDDWNRELYTRNFIKEFGLVDPSHDWNLAKDAVVKVNVGDNNVKSLKIYGKQGSKFYLIASLDDVKGSLNVPVDVPKDCVDLLFMVDGVKYYGSLDDDNILSRMSRGDLNDRDKYDPWKNNNPVQAIEQDAGHSAADYSFTRRWTATGNKGTYNEYQYFNSQQMSPIISNDVWEDYYSLNLGTIAQNTKGETGLLPESGDFTRSKKDITDHIDAKRTAGHTMTYDFTVTINDGALTFYPYFYGTNFTHDLGVYLLDKNGTPILKSGRAYDPKATYDPINDFVTFKIFEDRMAGDLQTQPHYYNDFNSSKKIDKIEVKAKKLNSDNSYTYLNSGNALTNGQKLTVNVGDKVQFELRAYSGTTLVYSNCDDNPSSTFESNYHTRPAFHVWDYDKFSPEEPTKFAEFTKDGLLTALCATVHNGQSYAGYMDIGIGANVTKEGDVSTYTGYSTVVGPAMGLTLQVNATPVAATDIDAINFDQTTNPNSNTNNLRYTTFGDDNICFYIPVNTTVTLPVVGSNDSQTVTPAVLSKLLCDDGGDSHYNITNTDGVFKITTGSSVTNVTESDITDDRKLPWAHIYYESSGVNGYQYPDDEPALGFKVIVYDPNGATTDHKHTQSFSEPWGNSTTTVPSAIASNWHSYFKTPSDGAQIDGNNYGTGTFSKPSRAGGEDLVIWSGTGYTSDWPDDKHFTEADNNYNWNAVELSNYEAIKFDFDNEVSSKELNLIFQHPDKGYWHQIKAFSITGSSFTLSLDEAVEDQSGNKVTPRDEIKYGIQIIAPEISINKVTLLASSSASPTISPIWAEDDGDGTGYDKALAAITNYYTTNIPSSITCDDSDDFNDFSGATVSVEIPHTATYDNIAYVVTWEKSVSISGAVYKGHPWVSSSSAPRRYGASRADAAKPAILVEGNNGAVWEDVNAAYSKYLPLHEEVSSYPHNMPMLCRTRGYDIYIKDPNGNKFSGKVGFYLKTKKKIALHDEITNQTLYEDNLGGVGDPYVLYSESKYNKGRDGNFSDQIAAISFKHPASGRTFFSFEDRRVYKKYGDTERASFWDYSSDRDINDMIFLLSNYDAIEGTGDKITEEDELIEDGFSWIWAVEDLGSFDDFDFNDVVVKIQSITQLNKHTHTVEASEDSETEDESSVHHAVMFKKVTFTPLCAGGTLPLYINLNVGDDVYVLAPGTYRLSDDVEVWEYDEATESPKPVTSIPTATSLIDNFDDSKAEIHKWFGNFPSTTMINTGKGPGGKVAKSCVIYVTAPTLKDAATGALNSDGFSINIFKNSDGKSVLDNYDVVNDASISTYFYVAVKRAGNVDQGQGNLYDDIDAFDGIINHNLGTAAQSFIIVGDSWKWPIERHHLLDAYPNFIDWVHNRSVGANWYSNFVSSELYSE